MRDKDRLIEVLWSLGDAVPVPDGVPLTLAARRLMGMDLNAALPAALEHVAANTLSPHIKSLAMDALHYLREDDI